MKKILFLIYFFLTVGIFSQSNLTGVVYYESGISQRNIDNYFSKERKLLKNKERIKFMDNFLLNSKKVVSTLEFSLNEALFQVNKKLKTTDPDNITEKMNLIAAGGFKFFYQNTRTQSLEIQNCQTLGECFIINSKFKKWKLTQETKKIAGFLCYKATTNIKSNDKDINVTAWYTLEIPVSFGPKEYNGLPGLILEVDNKYRYFKATKIILNPKQKIVIKKPIKGKKVSQEEFDKMSKEAFAKF